MALEDNKFWSMTHNADVNAVELVWKDASTEMIADEFKLALEQPAEHVREKAATGTLVDVGTFHFAPTAELDLWRRDQIIPKYNSAGLKRFAYLLPSGGSYRPGGFGDTEEFLTDWFDEPGLARAWLKGA